MSWLYYVKNLQNGKVYVGKTEQNLEDLFQKMIKYRDSNIPLFADLQNFGFRNFLFTGIGCFEEEKTNQLLPYFTAKFNSVREGYNKDFSADFVDCLLR